MEIVWAVLKWIGIWFAVSITLVAVLGGIAWTCRRKKINDWIWKDRP